MSELILLTGATGHLGFRTLVLALQAGYHVRVALRMAQQAEKLKATKSIQPHLSRVSFVEVPDITAPDAYAAAIKGVDHVLHIASPIPSPANQTGNWQEVYYDPAIKGTTRMLEAAATEQTVKTVVITSSVIVLEPKDRAGPGDVLSAPTLEEAYKVDNPWQAYAMSKILAHTAASDFVKTHNCTFNLIRVLPGYIQGPNELVTSASDLFSGSNEGTLNAITGNLAPFAKPTSQVWLDDAARAHLLALEQKDGDVFVVVGNGGRSVPWDEVAAVVEGNFPRALKSGVLKAVKGQESARKSFDVGSSERALGFKFAETEMMVEGLVEQFLRLRGVDVA